MESSEDIDSARLRWEADAAVLAEVGKALFPQSTRVQVRLPRRLADAASRAWDRDFTGELGSETDRERLIRGRAGDLGLIGLAVQERGQVNDDDVLVELDAWQIGNAFTAAEEAGLLGPST